MDSFDIKYIPASQIQPESGFQVKSLSVADVKKRVEEHFFSQGPTAYKIYKNALTASLGTSPSPEAFVADFFDILEDSIRLQQRETGNSELPIAIKEVFNIQKSAFNLLVKAGVKVEPTTFFATIVAFILGKLK